MTNRHCQNPLAAARKFRRRSYAQASLPVAVAYLNLNPTTMSAMIIREVETAELAKRLPAKLKVLAKGLRHPQTATVLFFSQDCVSTKKMETALAEITTSEPVLCFAENLTVEALQLAIQRKLPVYRLAESEESDEFQDSIDAIRDAPKPTKKQVEKARAELARLMSQKLGRSLSSREYKVIRGWDTFLVVEGEMSELIQGWSQQELLDQLAEMGAGQGAVALLNSLANGSSSLQLGQEQLLEFISPKGREILAGFEINAALEEFSRWLLNTLRADLPGSKIRALYFGLSETKGGCTVHLSGANSYDQEDPDWACASDWSPDVSFVPLGQKSGLWNRLRKAGQEPWVVAQAITIIMLRAFFKTQHEEFSKLTGLKRLYIVSGFVDGDLYAVQTPISPRT